MSHHVHVITAGDDDHLDRYLIGRLAAIWREEGHRVTVGPCEQLEADVGILHLDQTRVDAADLPRNPYSRPLLNGNALDISKRQVSSNLLTRDSIYSGAVIIKTDANHVGRPERAMASSSFGQRLRTRIGRRLPWRWTRELYTTDYPVLEDVSQVPDWVWARHDFIVERFRAEREGDQYVLRNWMFFGEEEYGARLYSHSPIVKLSNITHYDYLTTFPQELREARRRLGFDFGKFDYVEVDGEVVLLDANKTPWSGSSSTAAPNLRRLARGLQPYLP